jgi:hypothetical protein
MTIRTLYLLFVIFFIIGVFMVVWGLKKKKRWLWIEGILLSLFCGLYLFAIPFCSDDQQPKPGEIYPTIMILTPKRQFCGAVALPILFLVNP